MTRALKGAAVGLAVAWLAGCSTPSLAPPAPPPVPPQAQAAAAGEVIARNDRFAVYLPAAGDDLRSIAARVLGSEERDWVIAEYNQVDRVEPGQPLVVPLKSPNPMGVRGGEYQTVPILCYHRFGAGGGKMTVSAANFAAQLDWLGRNGYRVIRLADLVAYLKGEQGLPKRSVVITIDDGYESVYRVAYPLLRKHGYPATVFVYTDFIGAGDALNWAQLQELSASGLVDIQSHSKSHRNLIERGADETDELYRQSLDTETRVPRELLERRLAEPVKHYALPFGDANEAVLASLAKQNYTLAVTVNPGGNAFFAQPLMLHRTMIFGDHDLEAFKAKLETSRKFGKP
ncbi:polysaccharide deacetylase family protein [Ideonella sp.]|uniref:polysaccharide deacetylase family protein n=1 Tax=Ideonella sp. TaxID=1929293 RepID=UPI0035B48D5C